MGDPITAPPAISGAAPGELPGLYSLHRQDEAPPSPSISSIRVEPPYRNGQSTQRHSIVGGEPYQSSTGGFCSGSTTSTISDSYRRTAMPGLGNIPSIEVLDTSRPMAPLAHLKIQPGVPELHTRYNNRVTISKKFIDHTIPPLTTSYLNEQDPPGWCSFVHPEGALYFFHEEKRVFTDANLFNESTCSQINDKVDIIFQHLKKENARVGPGVDLVLDVISIEGAEEMDCTYYFADHQTRTIFYLDPVKASIYPGYITVARVESFAQIRHEVESQYWYHCLLFPRSFEITERILEEFRDITLFNISDLLTTDSSTSPYDMDDLQHILALVNNLQKHIGTQHGGSAAAIGRIMCAMARHKFHHYHGEPGARLDKLQSVHGDQLGRRSRLIKLLSPLLWFAPDLYLRLLDRMWVDRMINIQHWQDFVEKLLREWSEMVLYATVLLNANIAFLAVQGINSDSDKSWDSSPAQVAGYVSIVASVGSVLTGLLLVRQQRTKVKYTADDALNFLVPRNHPSLGLEPLATVYSLPYALLIWGLVFFVSAFLLVFFTGTTSIARGLLGSACAVVGLSTVWCVWMGRETYSTSRNNKSKTEIEELQPRKSLETLHEAPANKEINDSIHSKDNDQYISTIGGGLRPPRSPLHRALRPISSTSSPPRQAVNENPV
ncbi:hypothetical protein AX16_005724 [Volvariella volvacea WC 439]|nr:hypothetical protein AX16_005724 [Volvariella volvacea WC 439]